MSATVNESYRFFRDLLLARQEARRAELHLSEYDVAVDHLISGDLRITFTRSITPDVHQWLVENGWTYERENRFTDGTYVYVKSRPATRSRATFEFYLNFVASTLSFLGSVLFILSCASLARLFVWAR